MWTEKWTGNIDAKIPKCGSEHEGNKLRATFQHLGQTTE